MHTRAAIACLIVLLLAGCAQDRGEFPAGSSSSPITGLPVPVETASSPPSAPATSAPPAANGQPMTAMAAADIDTPSSLSVIVNKTRPFDPIDFAASDLRAVKVAYANPPTMRSEAATAVETMFADFTAETGLEMQSQSAYRSYAAQKSVYAGWVNSLGQKGADQTSARPGYSEHQTGLAIDISAKPAKCSLDQCFADTPQGTWLAANAWKYGFVLRYPDGLTSVTGYEFEPWHYRYIGDALAADYHASGATTLEQYFGLPDAPDYLG